MEATEPVAEAKQMMTAAKNTVERVLKSMQDTNERLIERNDRVIVEHELREAFGPNDVTPLGYGPPTPYTHRLVEQGLITLEQVDEVHWRCRRVKQ